MNGSSWASPVVAVAAAHDHSTSTTNAMTAEPAMAETFKWNSSTLRIGNEGHFETNGCEEAGLDKRPLRRRLDAAFIVVSSKAGMNPMPDVVTQIIKERSMNRSASFLTAALIAGAISQQARADEGVCGLQAHELLATWGFSASGQALVNIPPTGTPLVPMGPFAQVGTATGLTAVKSGTKITGTWTVTITQNDSSGKVTTYTEPGTFTVDTSTCAGDFYWNAFSPTQVIFHAVFVDHARQFRSIAAVPGLIISYTSGRKL